MDGDIVESAIKYICDRDEDFAKRMRQKGITRAVYTMLKDGGFDLQNLHKTGSIRRIMEAFI